MNNIYYTKNSNDSVIDSPFVKMANFFKLPNVSTSSIIGLPFIPLDVNIPNNPLYRIAANLLELSGSDLNVTAARIRHLDFIARNSALSDQITWKSSTAELWNKYPIFDIPDSTYSTNLVDIQNNIIQNIDFVLQLTDKRSDLMPYFKSYSLPEDTIAACLIALDSI